MNWTESIVCFCLGLLTLQMALLITEITNIRKAIERMNG